MILIGILVLLFLWSCWKDYKEQRRKRTETGSGDGGKKTNDEET